MATITSILILLCAGTATTDQDPLNFSVVLVQASVEQRETPYVDKALKPYAEALKSGPYNTFRLIRTDAVQAAYGQTVECSLNEDFMLRITPEKKDKSGRIVLKTTIHERKNGDRKAVDATSCLVPGKHVALGGLSTDNGALVVVVVAEE